MTSCIGCNNSIGSNFEHMRLSKNISPKFAVSNTPEPIQKPKHIGIKNTFANIIGFAIGIISPIFQLLDSFGNVTKESAKNMSDSLSSMLPDTDTLESTKETADKILNDSGLKEKGVNIHYVNNTDESRQTLKEILDDAIPKENKIKKKLNNNMFNIFSEGANAAYIEGKTKKTIIVPEKTLYSNIYHELGHAMNFNGNILSKSLVHAREMTPFGASIVAPIALLTSLLHKPDKSKPKKDKNIAEKTIDFISNHPVSLTALSLLPMLSEEGLASFRGLKYAKKYLPKETITALRKNYITAWSTYLTVAAGTIIGVWAGKNITDYIKNRKNNS